MRPSTPSPIYLYAYFQRILGGTLALRSRQDTATHAARDSNLGSGNHDMSRLSTLAYLNDAPIHGLTDIPLAYFQRILGVAPSPLALAETRQHPLAARDSNLGSGNHDMSRLSALAYLNDAPIHGLTDKPLAYFQRILGGTPALAPRTDTQHHNFGHTNALTHGHQTTYMHILSVLVGLRTSTWPLIPFVQAEHSSSADI
jgi:hypothetical protein